MEILTEKNNIHRLKQQNWHITMHVILADKNTATLHKQVQTLLLKPSIDVHLCYQKTYHK